MFSTNLLNVFLADVLTGCFSNLGNLFTISREGRFSENKKSRVTLDLLETQTAKFFKRKKGIKRKVKYHKFSKNMFTKVLYPLELHLGLFLGKV